MKEKAFSVEEIGHKDALVNSTVGKGQQFSYKYLSTYSPLLTEFTIFRAILRIMHVHIIIS